MATILRVGGGGGGSLNLTVVGGTTQPESPKENTVWVNTATAIWNVYIQASEPVNPSVGDVWIYNSTESGQNLSVLESPYLEITVGTVKQYDGSAWGQKDFLIYKNGEWLSSVLYIFYSGNWANGMNPNLFKKWDGDSDLVTSSSDLLTSIDADNDCLQLYLHYSSSSVRGGYTACPAVDVSKYNNLVVEYAIPASKSSSYNGKYQAMIASSINVTGGSTNGISIVGGVGVETASSPSSSVAKKEKTTYTTDISLLTGNYYPIFAGFTTTTTFKMQVYSMYLTS